MTVVFRYEISGGHGYEVNGAGKWVRYEDHAAYIREREQTHKNELQAHENIIQDLKQQLAEARRDKAEARALQDQYQMECATARNDADMVRMAFKAQEKQT